MAEATFRSGDPTMIDYTPSSGNVAAGEVVVFSTTTGLTCGIAHVGITNNVLGALAAGGGVYDVVNLNNAANYVRVWWDNTNNKVTTTESGNAFFGFVVDDGAGGANSTCRVMHMPYLPYT